MKIASSSSVCVIFVAIGRLGESSSTVPNMIGAKIAPRFSVLRHEGACGSRRVAFARTWRLVGLDVLRVELVALVVDPDVVVALLLRAAATLLLRGHRAIMPGCSRRSCPPAITVSTTGPPRW